MLLVIIVTAYVAAGVSVFVPLTRRLVAIHRTLVTSVTCDSGTLVQLLYSALAARGQPKAVIISGSATIEDRVDIVRNQIHLRASTEVTAYSLASAMRLVAMFVIGRSDRPLRFAGVAKMAAIAGGLAAPFLLAAALHSSLSPQRAQRTTWLTSSGVVATIAAVVGGAAVSRVDRRIRDEARAAADAVLGEPDLSAVALALSATAPIRLGPAALVGGSSRETT